MMCCLSSETIVGVNKYRLPEEETVDVLVIDNTKVREMQVLLLWFYGSLLSVKNFLNEFCSGLSLPDREAEADKGEQKSGKCKLFGHVWYHHSNNVSFPISLTLKVFIKL